MIIFKQFDFTNVDVIFSSFSNHRPTNRECAAAVWFLFATCRWYFLNTSVHHKGRIGSGNLFPKLIRGKQKPKKPTKKPGRVCGSVGRGQTNYVFILAYYICLINIRRNIYSISQIKDKRK